VWAGDPTFVELIARLMQGSGEFGRWWRARGSRHRAGTKVPAASHEGRVFMPI